MRHPRVLKKIFERLENISKLYIYNMKTGGVYEELCK